MSDETIIKWICRILLWASAALAGYWSNLFTFTPFWQPQWKLYLMFTVIGFMSSIAGHFRGWLKGYEFERSQD